MNKELIPISLLAKVPTIHVVNADLPVKAVRSKEVQERFAADSATGVGDTPAESAAFIKQEQTRWERVVKAAGIKAD